MPIPDYHAIMLPALRLYAAGEIRVAEAVDKIADEFDLPDQERFEILPSGGETRISNRVRWSLTHLVTFGLLERLQPGRFAITPKGMAILENPPNRMDNAFLKRISGLDLPESKTGGGHPVESEPAHGPDASTLEGRVEAAIEDLNAALREELLDRVLAMRAPSFERLIVDLMLAMGYRAKGSGARFERARDGGIEGIIDKDAPGKAPIYFQAKQYAMENGIGAERIAEFAGAADAHGVDEGIYLTTSHFALASMQFAQDSPKRLTLIDGDQLTRQMVKLGVAVQGYRIHELKKVDAEYFDDAGG